MREIRESFLKNGYYIVKDALSSSDVKTLRNEIIENKYGKRLIQPPELNSVPLIINVLKNKKVDKSLEGIFGSFYRFPSFQLQVNSFTQASLRKGSSGAHVDGIKELELNKSYMKHEQPAWANVGIYLQDHENAGYGGGIAILKGSHTFIRKLTKLPKSSFFIKLFIKITKYIPFTMFSIVATKPGDAVIFDNRLIHASLPTKPEVKESNVSHQKFVESIPKENTKLVFYWFAGLKSLSSQIVENNFYLRVEETKQKVETGGFDYSKACELDRKYSGDVEIMLDEK